METRSGIVMTSQYKVEQRDSLSWKALRTLGKTALLFLPDMFERRGGRPAPRPKTVETITFVLVTQGKKRSEIAVELSGNRIYGSIRKGDHVTVTGTFNRRNVLKAKYVQSLRTKEIIRAGWL